MLFVLSRFFAACVDLALIGAFMVIENELGCARNPIVQLLNLAVWLFYFGFLELKHGCTLGKRLFGLQVASRSIGGNRILQFGSRAFVRVFFAVPPLSLIYGLLVIWRNDGRSVADFVANTEVKRQRDVSSKQSASVLGKVFLSAILIISPFVFLFALLFVFVVLDIGSNIEHVGPYLELFR